MSNISNNLFEAIDIIVNKKLENADFDKTVKATVVSGSVTLPSGIKRYHVQIEGAESKTIADADINSRYLPGDIVYLLYPSDSKKSMPYIIGTYQSSAEDLKLVNSILDQNLNFTTENEANVSLEGFEQVLISEATVPHVNSFVFKDLTIDTLGELFEIEDGTENLFVKDEYKTQYETFINFLQKSCSTGQKLKDAASYIITHEADYKQKIELDKTSMQNIYYCQPFRNISGQYFSQTEFFDQYEVEDGKYKVSYTIESHPYRIDLDKAINIAHAIINFNPSKLITVTDYPVQLGYFKLLYEKLAPYLGKIELTIGDGCNLNINHANLLGAAGDWLGISAQLACARNEYTEKDNFGLKMWYYAEEDIKDENGDIISTQEIDYNSVAPNIVLDKSSRELKEWFSTKGQEDGGLFIIPENVKNKNKLIGKVSLFWELASGPILEEDEDIRIQLSSIDMRRCIHGQFVTIEAIDGVYWGENIIDLNFKARVENESKVVYRDISYEWTLDGKDLGQSQANCVLDKDIFNEKNEDGTLKYSNTFTHTLKCTVTYIDGEGIHTSLTTASDNIVIYKLGGEDYTFDIVKTGTENGWIFSTEPEENRDWTIAYLDGTIIQTVNNVQTITVDRSIFNNNQFFSVTASKNNGEKRSSQHSRQNTIKLTEYLKTSSNILGETDNSWSAVKPEPEKGKWIHTKVTYMDSSWSYLAPTYTPLDGASGEDLHDFSLVASTFIWVLKEDGTLKGPTEGITLTAKPVNLGTGTCTFYKYKESKWEKIIEGTLTTIISYEAGVTQYKATYVTELEEEYNDIINIGSLQESTDGTSPFQIVYDNPFFTFDQDDAGEVAENARLWIYYGINKIKYLRSRAQEGDYYFLINAQDIPEYVADSGQKLYVQAQTETRTAQITMLRGHAGNENGEHEFRIEVYQKTNGTDDGTPITELTGRLGWQVARSALTINLNSTAFVFSEHEIAEDIIPFVTLGTKEVSYAAEFTDEDSEGALIWNYSVGTGSLQITFDNGTKKFKVQAPNSASASNTITIKVWRKQGDQSVEVKSQIFTITGSQTLNPELRLSLSTYSVEKDSEGHTPEGALPKTITASVWSNNIDLTANYIILWENGDPSVPNPNGQTGRTEYSITDNDIKSGAITAFLFPKGATDSSQVIDIRTCDLGYRTQGAKGDDGADGEKGNDGSNAVAYRINLPQTFLNVDGINQDSGASLPGKITITKIDGTISEPVENVSDFELLLNGTSISDTGGTEFEVANYPVSSTDTEWNFVLKLNDVEVASATVQLTRANIQVSLSPNIVSFWADDSDEDFKTVNVTATADGIPMEYDSVTADYSFRITENTDTLVLSGETLKVMRKDNNQDFEAPFTITALAKGQVITGWENRPYSISCIVTPLPQAVVSCTPSAVQIIAPDRADQKMEDIDVTVWAYSSANVTHNIAAITIDDSKKYEGIISVTNEDDSATITISFDNVNKDNFTLLNTTLTGKVILGEGKEYKFSLPISIQDTVVSRSESVEEVKAYTRTLPTNSDTGAPIIPKVPEVNYDDLPEEENEDKDSIIWVQIENSESYEGSDPFEWTCSQLKRTHSTTWYFKGTTSDIVAYDSWQTPKLFGDAAKAIENFNTLTAEGANQGAFYSLTVYKIGDGEYQLTKPTSGEFIELLIEIEAIDLAIGKIYLYTYDDTKISYSDIQSGVHPAPYEEILFDRSYPKYYINASYIRTGQLQAKYINTEGLAAEKILVQDENNNVLFQADATAKTVEIDGACIKANSIKAEQIDATGLQADKIEVYTKDEENENKQLIFKADGSEGVVRIGGFEIDENGLFAKDTSTDESNQPWAQLTNSDNEKFQDKIIIEEHLDQNQNPATSPILFGAGNRLDRIEFLQASLNDDRYNFTIHGQDQDEKEIYTLFSSMVKDKNSTDYVITPVLRVLTSVRGRSTGSSSIALNCEMENDSEVDTEFNNFTTEIDFNLLTMNNHYTPSNNDINTFWSKGLLETFTGDGYIFCEGEEIILPTSAKWNDLLKDSSSNIKDELQNVTWRDFLGLTIEWIDDTKLNISFSKNFILKPGASGGHLQLLYSWDQVYEAWYDYQSDNFLIKFDDNEENIEGTLITPLINGDKYPEKILLQFIFPEFETNNDYNFKILRNGNVKTKQLFISDLVGFQTNYQKNRLEIANKDFVGPDGSYITREVFIGGTGGDQESFVFAGVPQTGGLIQTAYTNIQFDGTFSSSTTDYLQEQINLLSGGETALTYLDADDINKLWEEHYGIEATTS